jgi:hypothetical protein
MEIYYRVWDCSTQGLDCGDAAGQWISKYLGKPGCRIVFCSPDLERRKFINETKPWFTRTLETDYVRCFGVFSLTI